MKKITILLFCLVVGIGWTTAQTVQVSGTIIAADDGESLPGVSVLVKGTTQGTITNADGWYEISVSMDATLQFSYVGMMIQEIPVNGRQVINIVLETNTIAIQEVVVTALGISREKKSLGYATQEVKSEVLNMTGNTDLTKALQGKVAGVDLKTSSGMPGASSQVVIRGARSFTDDNTPLYVIDGMPVANTAPYDTYESIRGADIASRSIDIDPNDIESINILRGQAAAALYGLRASNGAIIITTKSGKGGAIDKTNVRISQTTSFDRVSRIPEYQKVYAQGTEGSFDGTNRNAWGPKISDLPNDPVYGGNSHGYPGKYWVPQLVAAGWDTPNTWVTPRTYDNWNDYFKIGVQSTTSVLVTRAENTGNFAVGLAYTDQTGIALNTGLQKWNAKASADNKVTKHITTGFAVNYVKNTIDKLTGANDGSIAGVMAAPPSYNLKGIPFHEKGDPYSQIYYRSLTFDNPYWVQYNNTFNEGTDRFFGNMYVQYATQLADNHKLSVKYQIGVDSYTSHYQDIMGYGSRGKTGEIANYGVSDFTYNSLLTAQYDWKIREDLDLNLIIGNELDHNKSKNYYTWGEDFNFGGWNHIGNTNNQEVDEGQWQSRTVGFFGSLSLAYLHMLYLNVTVREDISSTMPPNNRSFFYPSVSMGFVFTELAPVKELNWLSFGKLRGSYAEVGQASTRYLVPFFVKPNYSGSWWGTPPITYPLDGISSYKQTPYIYDPNLRPQNTKSWEIGIQMNFLNNRIGIDYTYADQNTVDQIFPVPLPGSSGAASLVTNGGRMKTSIHELSINYTPVITRDFRWDLNINYSKMKNEVVSLREGVESIYLGGFVDPQVRAGIGSSYPIIYGTTWVKDKQGRILVDEDPNSMTYGMPMPGEPGEIGKVAPDFILGGGSTLTYKDFSLGIILEWKQGGHMYSGMNGLNDSYGVSKRTEDRESTFVFNGYKADGTPNDIVRGGPNDKGAYETFYANVWGNHSEGYIYGNSFVKLRELSLSYAIPQAIFSHVDVRISAFARNMLLWTELPNADPESSQGNNNMMGGFERFSLPQTSSYGLGLTINF